MDVSGCIRSKATFVALESDGVARENEKDYILRPNPAMLTLFSSLWQSTIQLNEFCATDEKASCQSKLKGLFDLPRQAPEMRRRNAEMWQVRRL